MATTTNYGWTTPDDTALVKDGASAIRTLGSSVDTTTKALNPSTTLGDIEYRSSTANTNTRLGIGSTGNILTVAGGVPTWAAPAAGGGMTLISTYVANNTAATFTVSSISSSYKQLILTGTGIQSAGNGATISYRLNSDSGANYVGRALGFEAGGAQQSDPSGDVYGYVYAAMGRSTDTVNRFGSFWLNINNIQETDAYKGLSFNSSCRNNNDFQFYSGTGFWKNSATAVTSITVSAASNFNVGTFKLYGVA